MQILINSSPLEYTLEDETSLGEVIDGLEQWLRSGRFAIVSLSVNQTPYRLHDRDSWQSLPLDDINAVDIEAFPLTRIDETTLVAVSEFLNLLEQALHTANQEAVGEISAELPYVRDRVVQFFPALAGVEGAAEILRSPELSSGLLPEQRESQRIQKEIADLRLLLSTRAREYEQPVRELALTLGQLMASARHAVEAPLLLQTGREADAMQTVVTLTELLGRAMRLIPLVAEHEAGELDIDAVKEFAASLTPQLAELKEALEIRDTVLVGDLMEYEIAPRLERLVDILPPGGTP